MEDSIGSSQVHYVNQSSNYHQGETIVISYGLPQTVVKMDHTIISLKGD